MRGTCLLFTLLLVLLIGVSAPNISLNESGDSRQNSARTLVPVSAGTSVTVYERTGDYIIVTFSYDVLIGEGGRISTVANERYTITSDGTYLTSHCYRPYFNGGGHNIVAVRLNGVSGYPDGIWAGEVVSYILGTGGIPETRFNALGEHMENHTRLGDEDSELVLAFLVDSEPEEIEADLDCDPETLNLMSMGMWITCYIELPYDYDPKDIDAESIRMNGTLKPELDPRYGFVISEDSYIVDHDSDGTPERMVKFDRREIRKVAMPTEQWEITVTGSLFDGTDFACTDTLTTIHPQAKRVSWHVWTE